MPKSTGPPAARQPRLRHRRRDNVGWVAGTEEGRFRNRLYRLDIATGKAKSVGRIGDGSRTITGLAAVQDQDQ